MTAEATSKVLSSGKCVPRATSAAVEHKMPLGDLPRGRVVAAKWIISYHYLADAASHSSTPQVPCVKGCPKMFGPGLPSDPASSP